VTQRAATVLVGRGNMSLENKSDGVSMDLASQTAGIGLGVSAQGLTIDMPVAVNAPRVYALQFGFERSWVNAESRNTLDQLLDAWKWRFVSITLAGRTDTKEADNLNLSELRAEAVRNYLVGAGVVPRRITAKIEGEHNQQVPTVEGVRLRDNRVAVVTIQ
jgi:OmpA-OmpF porin, OOP family